MEFLQRLDGFILIWIQENIRVPILTDVLKIITSWGNAGIIWILFTIFLLLFAKYRKCGLACLISLLCGLVITNIFLKNAVHRIRPYEVVEGLRILIEKQVDWSFPSGHATSSIAAAMVMFWMLPKKIGVSALALALVICFSRLYVGVHYPSDVLVGILIGLFCAWIGRISTEKIYQVKKERRM